jgi:hypothetical protein
MYACFLYKKVLVECGGESDASFDGAKIVHETGNELKR